MAHNHGHDHDHALALDLEHEHTMARMGVLPSRCGLPCAHLGDDLTGVSLLRVEIAEGCQTKISTSPLPRCVFCPRFPSSGPCDAILPYYVMPWRACG